jgi:hypothetical protein
MATEARLANNGELKTTGTLDTRGPIIQDGLVAHYPMDGTLKGESDLNFLPYDDWIVGQSGTQSNFGANGDGNIVIEDQGPFGETTKVWQSIGNDVTSDADGGWNSSTYPVDSTKLYRFTTWIKREVLGNGSYYFGTHGYGGTNGVTLNSSASWAPSENPYFKSGSWTLELDKWYLLVAHIHPWIGYVLGQHPDSGIYEASNMDKIADLNDYRFHSSTTSSNHRSYLYYSTDSLTNQKWVYPRMEACDGTEPSLKDLVSGEGNITNPLKSKVRYIREYMNGSSANGGNHIVEIEAFTYDGTNIAAGKTATSNLTLSNGTRITDGNKDYVNYASFTGTTGYFQVDLGFPYFLDYIHVWNYFGDARTYHETKLQVSQDGVNYYDVFNSETEGEYQEDSVNGLGRKFYLDSSCPQKGASVYKNAVNYFENGLTKASQEPNWNGGGDNRYGIDPATGKQTILWTSTSSAYTYTNDNCFLPADLTAVSGTTMTFSLMIRRLEGPASSRVRVYDIINGYRYINYTSSKEFQKVSWTGGIGAANTRVFFMIDPTGGGTYEWHSLQAKILDHDTAYDDLGRTNDRLDYSMSTIDPNEGSFVIKFLWEPTVYHATSYLDMLDCKYDNSGNKFMIIRKLATLDGPSTIYFRDGPSWRSSTITGYLNPGEENMVVWAWKVGEGYRLYVNDQIVNGLDNYTKADTFDVAEYYKFSPGWDITEHSVYNRRLSDEEVLSLYQTPFKVLPEGIRAKGIETEPYLGGNHFPLTHDGKSYYKDIEPYQDTDVIYGGDNEVGGAFITHSTTNMVPNPESPGFASYITTVNGAERIDYGQRPNTRDDTPYYMHKTHVVHPGIGYNEMQIYWIDAAFAMTANIPYTYSQWIYASRPSTVQMGLIKAGSPYTPYLPYKNFDLDEGWNFCSITGSYGTTITDGRLQNGIGLVPDDTTIAYYKPQLEQSDYSTPFVTGVRAGSSLLLPYDVIDCKTDFTIYGWWFPKVYADALYRPCLSRNVTNSNSTYNRILIMGNGTSSNTLRCWHGSDGVAESSIYSTTAVVVGEWNFFALRRSGANMQLAVGNHTNGYSISGISATAYRLNADETGQHWHIGEYANNESDASHRDYVFEQSAISDADLEAIYRRKMKIDKYKGITPKSISTHQTI